MLCALDGAMILGLFYMDISTNASDKTSLKIFSAIFEKNPLISYPSGNNRTSSISFSAREPNTAE